MTIQDSDPPSRDPEPSAPGEPPRSEPPPSPAPGEPPSGPPPPGNAGGGPPPPGDASGGPPPRRGLSTGAKIAIGCGALAVLGVVVLLVAVAVFGWFVRDRAQELGAGIERQMEVSQQMERLREEHPFQPPDDGVVTAEQAQRFFAATDRAWSGMEEWAGQMADLQRRMEGRERPGLRELAEGFRGAGGLAESRAVLTEALVEERMSVGEYLWTGFQLMRAHEELDRAEPSPDVPDRNIELARRHRAELDEIARSGGNGASGEPGKGIVLHLATLWGMTDGGTWQAFGLDTLSRYAR